ncbi:MAG: hypothetical protein EA382_14430 [Spirochaetaceae bacterium]|nr:MAG: hypothetical protein EA382_14430 [Spirochaetaceae bacterium]
MDPNKRTRILATAGIVVVAGALVFAGYTIVTRSVSRIGVFTRPTGVSTRVERSEDGPMLPVVIGDLGEFTAVAATGGWKITIAPGDFAVQVFASDRAADQVRVSQRDGTLSLDLAPGTISVSDGLEAEITVPDLRRIDIRGGANVRFAGFDLESLALRIDGAASVVATNGTIGSLDLVVNGAANVDLSDSPVVDARVALDGASNLTIAMAGGELSGSLRGVGNVTYTGDVTTESIRVEGLGRVRRR